MCKYIVFLIFLCFTVVSSGQSFQGSIFYSYHLSDVSPDVMEKSIAIQGEEHWQNSLHTNFEFYISKDTLVSIYKRPEGSNSIVRQVGEIAEKEILQSDVIWTFEKDPGIKIKDLLLKKKTNEKKEILGFICRKYIYEHDVKHLVIEAWITECFPFNPKIQTKKYFSNLFTEKGLILEHTRFWTTATQTMKAEKIIFEPQLPEKIRDLLIR